MHSAFTESLESLRRATSIFLQDLFNVPGRALRLVVLVWFLANPPAIHAFPAQFLDDVISFWESFSGLFENEINDEIAGKECELQTDMGYNVDNGNGVHPYSPRAIPRAFALEFSRRRPFGVGFRNMEVDLDPVRLKRHLCCARLSPLVYGGTNVVPSCNRRRTWFIAS